MWLNLAILLYSEAVLPYGEAIFPYSETILLYGGKTFPYGEAILPYGGAASPYSGVASPYGGVIFPYSGTALLYGKNNPEPENLHQTSGWLKSFNQNSFARQRAAAFSLQPLAFSFPVWRPLAALMLEWLGKG